MKQKLVKICGASLFKRLIPQGLRARVARGVGIDLGTANTILYVEGRGVVLNQPSVVAVHNGTGKVVAVGAAARSMLGRVPINISVCRPLRDGVIADFERAEAMIQYFVKQAVKTLLFRSPDIVICVPSGATPVERRAIHDAALSSGARSVFLVEEAMAAAMGAGLAVMDPIGSMVVDIGGGTSEVAVISLGGIVSSLSIRCGGDRMDEAIVQFFRRHHDLLVGEPSAERLKCTLYQRDSKNTLSSEEASSTVTPDDHLLRINGRDLKNGRPREMRVSSEEIIQSLQEPISMIVDAVQGALETTPPELSGDIAENGIVLTGGGALLVSLKERIEQATGVKVRVAEDPLLCVARGTGCCLERLDELIKLAA